MTAHNPIDWSTFRIRLKSFIRKQVRHEDIADDIVQDVFLKVQNNISQLQSTDKLIGWIYRIAKNTISDHYRKTSKQLSPPDLDWETDWRALNECVTTCLQETMSTLPPKYREALQLAELENVSQNGIGGTT